MILAPSALFDFFLILYVFFPHLLDSEPFLLATSLESASPNALLMAVLNPSQVSYMLCPLVMDGSIHAQAFPRYLELA
jgi:uncharacterized membrane protein (DUF485 family)